MMSRSILQFLCVIAGSLLVCAVSGCDDMSDNARQKTFESSEFFPDGRLARHPVPGTVPVSTVTPALLATRDASGKHLEGYPFEITEENLKRGRQRYDIYCAVCHGAVGYGDGMIVRRGFVTPPSFHGEKLREMASGHVVEVITNGWGAMYSYSDRINPEDRWNIAAYIETLRLSQRADPNALSAEERQRAAGAQQQTTQPATRQSN